MPRPTRLRSLRGWAGCRFERLRSPAIYCSSTFTRWRTLRSMPESTGLSVCSAVLPIRPRPSARNVPRWRWVWPIALRTCVSFTFATWCHLLGHALGLNGGRNVRLDDLGLALDHGSVRQHVANRLAAGLRDVLGPAQLAQSRLC